MKILVVDIAASEGGALSVLKSFYNYISQYELKHRWYFWLGDNFLKETSNIEIKILKKIKANRFRKLVFDFWTAKYYVNQINPDVIFSLQNTCFWRIKSIPQIIYMHQSIPFQSVKSFSFFKQNERKMAVIQYLIGKIIKMSVKKANMTIVQTKWIHDAVIESTKISSDKIKIVFPEIEKITNLNSPLQFSNTSFFYPAAAEEYKNHDCIYNAVEELRSKGIKNFKVYLTIEGRDSENIIHLGRITRDKVIDYLKKCVLIFPSYIETVGLPMLEGKIVGTVVFASDCPFSHEILDGYGNAFFFNPFNYHELSCLMEKMIKREIDKNQITNNKQTQTKNSWEIIVGILEDMSNAYKS